MKSQSYSLIIKTILLVAIVLVSLVLFLSPLMTQAIQTQVTICHFPPGNPGNPQTIEVAEASLPAHFSHGDYEGICGGQLTCTNHQITVVSDTTNTIGNGNAVETWDGNASWTASIPGADWIWSHVLVQNPSINETVTFEKEFEIVGTPLSGVLDIAADNRYTVWLNGEEVGLSINDNNYSSTTQDQYIVLDDLGEGNNILEAEVTNIAFMNSPYINPAGLLYSLTIESEECI